MADISKLGKYEIRGELGRGAMGVVYEAYDPAIERSIALKTIRREALAGAHATEILARFRREAQAAGKLTHPNIVSVYDFGEDDGVSYIAMELVRGPELKSYFEENRALRAEGRREHHDADPRGARLFAQARRGPSRHQARERVRAARRHRQGRRLRHRARRVLGTDAGGHGARHAGLHVAGADPRHAGGRPLRPLLGRRDPLPVPHRRASVHRQRDDHHAQGPRGGSAAAVAFQHAVARRPRCRGAQGARQEARRALRRPPMPSRRTCAPRLPRRRPRSRGCDSGETTIVPPPPARRPRRRGPPRSRARAPAAGATWCRRRSRRRPRSPWWARSSPSRWARRCGSCAAGAMAATRPRRWRHRHRRSPPGRRLPARRRRRPRARPRRHAAARLRPAPGRTPPAVTPGTAAGTIPPSPRPCGPQARARRRRDLGGGPRRSQRRALRRRQDAAAGRPARRLARTARGQGRQSPRRQGVGRQELRHAARQAHGEERRLRHHRRARERARDGQGRPGLR